MVRSARRGWLSRIGQTVRSYTLGPLTLKDRSLAKYFNDGQKGLAGVTVTEDSAYTYAAFWQGVGLIAGHIASFPLIPYKRLPNGGKERQAGTRLYRLLHDEFNPYMSSFTAREVMQAHALTWGNAYAEIERDNAGRPLNLWPITPDRVQPYFETDGNVYYRVYGLSGQQVIIPARDMIHVAGLGFDGLCGYGVVRKARESLGLAMAAERFGAAFFGNGSTFGGILTAPESVAFDDEDEADLRASIEKFHQGVERAHRFLILHNGLSYQNLGIPPKDAEFLETRRFQIEEVARWLNLPPHKLKHLDRSTNNNIEHQGIEYHTDTLWPWQVRWEQEFNRKLIPSLERNLQFVEFMPDAVLRGDIASRYAAYAIGRQWGWLSADDVRDKENMNPLPNESGQIYLVPMNMAPANRINDLIDAQVRPDPAPAPSGGRDAVDPEAVAAALRKDIETITEAINAQMAKIAEAEAARVASAAEAEGLRSAQEADRAKLAELQAELAAKSSLLQLANEQVESERRAKEAAQAARIASEAALAEARVRADDTSALAAQLTVLSTELRSDADRLLAEKAEAEAKISEQEEQRRAAEHAASRASEERDRAVEAQREAEARAETAATAAEDAQRELTDAEAALVTSREALQMLHAKEIEEAQARLLDADKRALDVAGEAIAAKAAADEARAKEAEARNAEEEARTSEAAIKQRLSAAAEREQAMLSAHRRIYVHEMTRLIRRENQKARRYGATPQKLKTWIANYYNDADERAIFAEHLSHAMSLHLLSIGSEAEPLAFTDTVIDAHFANSVEALSDVVSSDRDQFDRSLERVLQRWESERAVRFADQLIAEEMNHVRLR